MNEGTNVLKLLNGDQNPLNHGYIAVKGRSQKDINEGKTIELGLADEIKFFENNPDYSAISHRQGVKYLSRKISLIMHNHIKKQLPNIRKKIDERYSKDLKRIEAISLQKEFETDNDAHKWIIDRIADYCKIYTELIDGTSVQKSTEELKGGAKIYATIEKSFRKHIDKMDPFDYLTDKEIRTSIISVRGVKPELMIPEEAARILIKQQIARLAEPCEQCCQLVHCELVKIIKLPKYDEFKKYIKLMDFIEQTMANLLETYMNKVIVIIKNIIAGESNHINFDHDDFIYLKPYCLLLSKINEHDLKRVVDTLKIDPAYFEDDNDNLNFDESQEIVNDNQLEDDSPDHATILLSERDMEYMPSYNPNNNININSRPTILRRVREKLEVRDEATQKEEMQVIIMKRLISYF